MTLPSLFANAPTVTKFIDNSPEGLKKAKAKTDAKRKAKEKKMAKKSDDACGKKTGNGRGAQKRSRQVAENDEDDGKDEGITKGRPPKKVKDTDDETPPRFTVYIHITAPEPAIPARLQRGAAKPAPAKLVKKGPFFWTIDDSSSFATFKEALAKTIPCKQALLPVTQMEWRYEKPANDSNKLPVSEAGFEAMAVSLAERKKDFVILIIMPPPGKDEAVDIHQRCFCRETNNHFVVRHGIPTMAIMSKTNLITIKKSPQKGQIETHQRRDKLYVLYAISPVVTIVLIYLLGFNDS